MENEQQPIDLTQPLSVNKPVIAPEQPGTNLLDTLGQSSGGAPLLSGLPDINQTAPLDDGAINRRAFMYTIGSLEKALEGMNVDLSLLEAATKRRQQVEETIRTYGDTDLREQATNDYMKEHLGSMPIRQSDLSMWNIDKGAAEQSMALKFIELQQDRDMAAAEKKFVSRVQGLLESGNVAEADMVSTLWRNPNAWAQAVERQEDYLYMQKALEDAIPEEKDRNFLFGLIDLAFLFQPFISSTANTGNYDGPLVQKHWYDDVLSGERLRNEVWAIRSIQDPVERRKAYTQLGQNIAKSTTDFGWVNKTQQSMLKDYFLNGPPSAVETNVFDAIDAALAPLVLFDILAVAKGAKLAKISTIKTMKRAGLRTDAMNVVKDAAGRIFSKGEGQAYRETGLAREDVEDEMLPSGLNPNATPGDTSLAGGVTPDETVEQMAERLFGNATPTERLSPEEQASLDARYRAQVKKDFGRHVHDVQYDPIQLTNGSRVISPVVTLGTTKDSLFITKRAAEEQLANIGLESAVVKPIPSDNGILYGIEARLPLSESQFYAPLDKPPGGNFITRFLLGARQISSPELSGLSEVAVAKHQKTINTLQREFAPLMGKLNNDQKNILNTILVRSEAEKKWFSDKELDVLWARQAGIGDDGHEIVDTEIRLGDIAAPGGDPEFIAQRNFAELKDRSAVLGKQADDLFKASGEADEAAFWKNTTPENKAIMDELTKVNAEIAKGPQRGAALETFLEPHTYKAWRDASATPPPAKGMVRVYHGGIPGEGSRWVTDSLQDAKGWANRGEGMIVQYVDIPKDHIGRGLPEDIAFGVTPRSRFELSAEEMANAKPFKEGPTLFPPEHEDLWQALDVAADRALAKQAGAGEQAMRSTQRAAMMMKTIDARKATEHLDDFIGLFKNGVLTTELTAADDIPTVQLFGFTTKADLDNLIENVQPMSDFEGLRKSGVRALELPGGRIIAWQGHLEYHDNVLNILNALLEERGLPLLNMEDVTNIYIPVGKTKSGNTKVGKVEITSSDNGGVWNNTREISYGDFARMAETYSVSGPAFAKRARDAERRANKAMEAAMTGGKALEAFKADVDQALTMTSTKLLKNASGQTLHTNGTRLMAPGLQWSEDISGFMPESVKRVYHKWRDIYKLEHILRNDDVFLQKHVRGFQTIGMPGFADVDGVVYRAGSLPPVPRSRVFNYSDNIHYIAESADDVKPGYGLRLTDADIKRMLTKEGYIMVRLEQPVPISGNVNVQWIIAKAGDIEVKPLKYEQVGTVDGGHRGYLDKHFAKQTRVGTQGDTGSQYLMNPHTFMVGTEAEVKAWARVMEDARAIWNNTDDAARRLELLRNHLDGKPGFPSAEEFAQMIDDGKFNPDYPVEALYDREMPSDYAKLRTRGWEDMADDEVSGINTYMQTHGKMYTSPKGDHLPDWRGQNATLIDPFEMMNKALNNVASLSSMTDYKMRSIEKWVKTFGPYLDLSGIPKDASPVRIFQESVFLRDMPEAQKVKNAAEAQRDVIKRNLGWRSEVDREFEYMGRKLVSFVAGNKPGKWNKSMARGMEYVNEKDPLTKARKMAFHMKLGLGNVAQFPMQISTMLAVLSLDLRRGIESFSNLFPMRGMILHSSGEEWVDWAIESGFHKMAGFENDPAAYKAMMLDVKKSGFFDLGGSHQLSNYYGIDAAMSGTTKFKPGPIGEVKDLANKAMTQIADKGTFFFTEAELWNRTMAFQLAWKELHKSGKFIKGTPQFYEALLQKSADYTFNMSRAGSAAWQKGWASIPTQFLSYQARVLEAIFGKQLTLTQKIRLGLGQFLFYGTAGIPFMAFASEMLRGQEGEAPKLGTWEGLVDRGVIDTIIFATTGADVQYGERAATGAFITDTFRELFGMSKYGEVSFVDVMAGPVGAMIGDTSKTFLDVVKYVAASSGGETGLPLASTSIISFARNISSFDNAFKAMMVWNYGEYITKSGKVVLDDLPSTDAFAVFLGLTPGEYRDYVAKQDWRRNRQETVKQVANKIVEHRERLWREPQNADAITAEAELLYRLTPSDVYIDAADQADKSSVNDSIYDGIARRYEIEKQQQQLGKNK